MHAKRKSESRSEPPPSPTAEEEVDLFRRVMAGVTPLPPGPRRVPPAPPPRSARQVPAVQATGEAGFCVEAWGESLEGSVADLDGRTRRRLRRGDYSIEGTLDLHGQTMGEARESLAGFLAAERSLGHRCVLIVHGRGHGDGPVIKPRLPEWLAHAPVLAFCTARPHDGGYGAVYVLLRR